MAKLTEFTNPVSGKTENLLSVKSWTSNALGIMFLLAVAAVGTFLFNSLRRAAPGPLGNWFGTPTPLVRQPVQAAPTGPSFRVWK